MGMKDLENDKRVISFKQNLAIQELVDELRDKDTDPIKFRKGLNKLGRYMGYELSKTFDYKMVDIDTPVSPTKAVKITDKDNIVMINILRAAIPFIEGFYKVFPKARAGIISAWRGPAPESKISVEYVKVPKTFSFTGTLAINEIGVFDAASSGNMLLRGKLSATKNVGDGDSLQVNATVTFARAA